MRKGLLIILLLLMIAPFVSLGQGCSVCSNTAANLDDKSAKGMNAGILYLASFPLTILGTIGFIWWRHNKSK